MADSTNNQSTYATSERTGWTGWIAFAGIMMIISGALNALYGLVGIFNDEWVVWTNRGSLLVDITQWGWAHLIIGLVVLLSGIGVFSGNVLARTVGVVAVAISLHRQLLLHPGLPAVGDHRGRRSTCSSSGRSPPTARR